MENNFLNPNFTLVAKNVEFIHKVAKKYMKGYYADFAEDVAQTSILKALEKIDLYNATQSKFTTWVYQLVKNTCFDFQKKKRAFLTEEGFFDSSKYNVKDEEPNTNYEKFKKLRELIFSLNDRDTKLLILKIRFNCSAREMSHFTDLPEKSINTFVLRAKCNLQTKLINSKFEF